MPSSLNKEEEEEERNISEYLWPGPCHVCVKVSLCIYTTSPGHGS